MLKRCLIVLAGSSIALVAVLGQTASFDCKGRLKKVEQIICSDPTISQFDDELAAAYRNLKVQTEHAPKLVQAQQRWLAARNACKDNACVRWAYETRLSQLRHSASTREPGWDEQPGGATGGGTADNPAIGDWDAGSKAFWGLKLEVKDNVLTIGPCSAIPYIVIRDDYGADLDTITHEPQERWRKIALELPPHSKSTRCGYDRVLEFAVRDDMFCHAEIAMFETPEEYEGRKYFSWGVWENMKCRK